MNLNNLDKKLIKRLGLIVGIVVIMFLAIFIIKLILGNRISYNKIEDNMIESAREYYQDNPSELPVTDHGVATIDITKLIELKYLKDLSKLVKDKNATCQGQVTVTNNNGYYLYSASLDCGDYYKTKKLTDILTSNIVTSGSGLYNNNGYYLFRGEKVNNNVSFAGKNWLILRINNDGTIRMIETTNRDTVVWDDRYNSDRESNVGINNFYVSRIKDTLQSIYNDSKEFSEGDKSYISNQNLCLGKRDETSTIIDGSTECSSVFENQPLGLLQVNEYALASIDGGCTRVTNPECTNYNYLVGLNSYWTLTADVNNSYKVFKIAGSPFTSTASGSSRARIVVHINAGVNYVSGDGTSKNPYVFK